MVDINKIKNDDEDYIKNIQISSLHNTHSDIMELCIIYDAIKCIKVLIENNYRIDKNPSNYSYIMIALKASSFRAFELLLENNADILYINKYNESCLSVATRLCASSNGVFNRVSEQEHNYKINLAIDKLCKMYKDKNVPEYINLTNDEGNTALMYTYIRRNYLRAKTLIMHGANIFTINKDQETLMTFAEGKTKTLYIETECKILNIIADVIQHASNNICPIDLSKIIIGYGFIL